MSNELNRTSMTKTEITIHSLAFMTQVTLWHCIWNGLWESAPIYKVFIEDLPEFQADDDWLLLVGFSDWFVVSIYELGFAPFLFIWVLFLGSLNWLPLRKIQRKSVRVVWTTSITVTPLILWSYEFQTLNSVHNQLHQLSPVFESISGLNGDWRH